MCRRRDDEGGNESRIQDRRAGKRGETPAVDVINTTTSFVANREVLDTIPTTDRNTVSRALLIPGTTVTPFVLGQYNLTSHGSSTSDFTIAIDGGTPGSSATRIGPPPAAGSCPPVSSHGGMIALPSVRPGAGETFTEVPR